MRYFISFLIAFFFPVYMWGQFSPSNPGEPTNQAPEAYFHHSVYKNGVIFTPYSNNATKYEWNFGDGTTSTEKYPEHIYTQPDKYYEVTLTATNGVGSNTYTGYVYIDPESEYSIYGDFTLDPYKTGIRNFQSLDAMFQDLLELPIRGNITITVAAGLDLRFDISAIADELNAKLANSSYSIQIKQADGYSSAFYLWDTFNKESYEQFKKLFERINCSVDVYVGECRFDPWERSYLFQAQTICSGNQSSYIGFDGYSRNFTYEWQLAETPAEGLSGYQESGTGNIPNMPVTNTSGKYQPLVYNVSFKYQGEEYDSDQVTFWCYPEYPT